MHFWCGFIAGGGIGMILGITGMCVYALCVAGSKEDRRREKDIAGTGGDKQAEKRRFRDC